MNRDPQAPRPRKPQPTRQPTITTASKRRLPCYPASVFAFVVDSYDRFLLLRRPGQTGWEAVNGSLLPGESVPDAVTRELQTAAGEFFLANYLGVLDTFTFVFDANLPPLISICCLLRHRGGEVYPGRELRDAEFRWWALTEIDEINLAAPRARWDLLHRAVDMSHWLQDARDPEPEDDVRGGFLDFPWRP